MRYKINFTDLYGDKRTRYFENRLQALDYCEENGLPISRIKAV